MELTKQNFIFCTKCGNESQSTDKFCNSCGSVLRKHEFEGNDLGRGINTSTYTDNGYTEEEMKLFISKNQEFYLTKFEKITRTANKKTWNWSAFFLNIYWMVYRKMYLEAALFTLVSMTISFLNPVIAGILQMAFTFGIPIFANSLYLNYINRKFKEINCADSNRRQILINKYGGTNILGAVVICIVLSMVSIIKISLSGY